MLRTIEASTSYPFSARNRAVLEPVRWGRQDQGRKFQKDGAQGLICVGTTWWVTSSHLNLGPLGFVLIQKAVFFTGPKIGSPRFEG